MSEEETISVKDALNEYFRLKEMFENSNKAVKKKIINNPTLSKREKREEYIKIKPKCINCKRPSKLGTIFSTTFHPTNDTTDSYRSLKVICGVLADPCNLNVEINLGKYYPLDKLITEIRDEIKDTKNTIISDKNRLLFGLITTETAIEEFETNKRYISNLTSLYEGYLDKWNKIVENHQKKTELEETLVQSYTFISEIKESIKKLNVMGNNQYAIDAANIYHNKLKPTLDKIRTLKYRENLVFNDETENVCKLIQKPYSEMDTLFQTVDSKVISYDIGLKGKDIKKKNKPLIIESDEEEEPKIKIQPSKIPSGPVTIEDEPIIGKGEDGIEWNEPEYKNLWSKLSPKLKSAFKLNIDWMKEFMNKCVNERVNHGPSWSGCRLPTPPNLVLPPRVMSNGQYDFGVSIYNEAFNKLPVSQQKTYLTLYKEDPQTKAKNYKMLEESLNSLVEKEVDFGRGFF
jgi:hypothetical protein